MATPFEPSACDVSVWTSRLEAVVLSVRWSDVLLVTDVVVTVPSGSVRVSIAAAVWLVCVWLPLVETSVAIVDTVAPDGSRVSVPPSDLASDADDVPLAVNVSVEFRVSPTPTWPARRSCYW